MTEVGEADAFCVLGVPCFVMINGVGPFSSNEWGFSGMKIQYSEDVQYTEDQLEVLISLDRYFESHMKMKAQFHNYIDGQRSIEIRYINMSDVQSAALIGMVVSAALLSASRSS